MINFVGLSHINIVVENISEGIEYYKKIFNAIPLQEFPHFKNIGFAKSAGFLETPENVDVSIVFLQIPNTNITLELMQYHSPKAVNKIEFNKLTYQSGNVGHIALKVNDIDKAFAYLKTCPEVKLISQNKEYKPYKIDQITVDEFKFFDKTLEKSQADKENVCDIVSQIKYFYFIDKYGIQWELEEGHSDIGE